jgi:hypothetical protein
MLVYVDDQKMDLAGNQYPKKGRIEAKIFVRDIDLQTGLCGIPWGQTNRMSYEDIKSKNWVVAKVEKNNDIIRVNYFNRFKFRSGYVSHVGSLRSCSSYIWKNRCNQDMIEEGSMIRLKNVAGSKEWSEQYNKAWSRYVGC